MSDVRTLPHAPEAVPPVARQTAWGLTLFALPKPWTGAAAVAQSNALSSWLRLGPAVDVVLFGDAPGIAQAAAAFGVRHVPHIAVNRFGTPLVSDAFRRMALLDSHPWVAYCNADLILLKDFLAAVQRLDRLDAGPLLATGRRINIDLNRPLQWSRLHEIQWLLEQGARGERESILCKDYFAFRRGHFADLPAFAVGRGNWDNWMVHTARQKGMKVVDLTRSATVLHPRHGHAHVRGGKGAAYVSGPEARDNEAAGGGRFWIRGAAADWELTIEGLRRRRGAALHWAFWRDAPRAIRLAWSLWRNSRSRH